MATKILYYLGAGASAKALPISKSIWPATLLTHDPKPSIPGLAYELENFSFVPFVHQGYNDPVGGAINVRIEELKRDFKSLANSANQFGDVDTYAKFLNINDPGGTEFIKLKTTLSQYLTLKQASEKALDNRYLPWLIGLMSDKSFPDNVKILSWNYDYQVESAAAVFEQPENIEYNSTGGFAYKEPLIRSYPNSHPFFKDFDKLSLLHLNGVAGFYINSTNQRGSVFQPSHAKDNGSIFTSVATYDLATNMHFAWESGNYHSDLMAHMHKMIDGIQILVVIGYSFPFYNRDIDKKVFNKLKEHDMLQKIYYQDPYLDGKQLISQFELRSNFPIQHIKQTNNFHIPFEY